MALSAIHIFLFLRVGALRLPPRAKSVFSLFLSSSLCDQPDGRADKAVFFSQLVLEEAPVAEVHQRRIVDVYHERRRIRADLSAIEQL